MSDIKFPGEISAPSKPYSQNPANSIAQGFGGVEKYGAIDSSGISVTNINASNISTGTLSADRIGANTITGTHIATGTVEADEMASNSITSAKIVAGTIEASDIKSNTITATQIASGTITASEIATGTITANEMGANSITSAKIAAGTIVAADIASNTITGVELTTSRIDTVVQYVSGGIALGGSGRTPAIDLDVDDVARVGGKFSSGSYTAVDKSSGASNTYSLEISNNDGNGGALADFYSEYSESTEIEAVSPTYRITDQKEMKRKVKKQIQKRAKYKINARFKDSNVKMTKEVFSEEQDRVLNKKDWSRQIAADVKSERVSNLEWGTLLAFSEEGAIPTSGEGQTNIMGVVASYPSRTSHVQDSGIEVCKSGKTYLKVKGPCTIGGLLKASDEAGVAMTIVGIANPGSIVGRTRVNKRTPGIEVIEVDLI